MNIKIYGILVLLVAEVLFSAFQEKMSPFRSENKKTSDTLRDFELHPFAEKMEDSLYYCTGLGYLSESDEKKGSSRKIFAGDAGPGGIAFISINGVITKFKYMSFTIFEDGIKKMNYYPRKIYYYSNELYDLETETLSSEEISYEFLKQTGIIRLLDKKGKILFEAKCIYTVGC